MDLKMIGEKALCDFARLLIQKGESTKYVCIEAALESIDFIDENGKRFLKLNAIELGFDAICPMIKDFKKMVYKRGTPNLILFNIEDNYDIVPINKYDNNEQENQQ